jgi:chemotaxis protein CheX
MKIEYVNPFIESIYDLFAMMLDCEAKRGDVNMTLRNEPPLQSVVAIIGLSGSVRGCVTMVFPERTAINVTQRLLGSEINSLDQTVMDSVAELINIVAGGAKAKLNGDQNDPANLSLPTVIQGRDYVIQHPSWSMWLDIPFDSPLGSFNLSISIETDRTRKGMAS